mmetsp:Transcript_10110/g.20889  ORF Transcript_10110/g.20889 Transcript_10110/m.20889 type:complete len:724 (-) Transcript_10110:98-2269(-)|eukprot:CAMPEP_0172460804 /NCGR_PEP_ID=MMETSP1065-20121228/38390_1 /TAXON_ID=265537 /ORGANISM="Amphiprora paludosa, Strain CCMP125" /LENGTH=723 /DNA_ID=CAMNT_0013215949 /DNA_START=168 /DNA_END=2339 /DNA_ORIENTATION=+
MATSTTKKSWPALIKTLVTVLSCLCVILALQTFHSNQKEQQTPATQGLQRHGHLLREENIDNDPGQSPIDDDETRDDTCRDYLMKFLNGTTDAKDECVGMYNAWSAADCKDDSEINNLRFLQSMQDDENKTDDATIDDIFEEWECCGSISQYYSKHCEEESLDAARLFGIVAVLIVCWLAKSLLRVSGWQWIPDAGACILVGALVGGVLRILWTAELVNTRMIFNNNLFLQILLPPIIFEASLSIDKRAFRRDLFPILTFAIPGTGLSAITIGYITYHVSALGSGTALPLLESLLFGALMSSIDPVATLSILSGVGVGQGDTLYTLVFGESLLNDGVAIVLFDSLVRHIGDTDVVGQAALKEVLLHFFMVTIGSLVVGFICGALCTFYFWAMAGKNTAVAEGALFFTWALIPYYIADAFELSGIISIGTMGFMLDYFVIGGFAGEQRAEWTTLSQMDGQFDESIHPVEPFLDRFKHWCGLAFSGRGHLQEHARSHVGYVAEVISSIVETAIFAYLGLFLFNDKEGNFQLTAAGVFACVSSRAGMVVILCAVINIFVWFDVEMKLANLWRSMRGQGGTVNPRQAYEASQKVFLGPRTQFILFTAGIRGAVSYALVQNIPVYDSVSRHGSVFKGELRAMTSATIVGVLFVFGALTYFGVDRRGMPAANSGALGIGDESTLSQMLMDERLMDDAQHLAASEEERERAASFEVDAQHQQHVTQHMLA